MSVCTVTYSDEGIREYCEILCFSGHVFWLYQAGMAPKGLDRKDREEGPKFGIFSSQL